MEGPTPVSALIHAATMVTAGVYLLARCAPLFVLVPGVQLTVAIIGAATALLAAFIALTQHDLKRVLAYSTVSQIGFMFLAAGCAGPAVPALAITAALFHLFTHAFFKAVLFLSAGSVMHGMHDVIDMREFGGLKRVLPVTRWTFLCGALALAGVPVFAGFWSKDMVLESALAAGHADRFGWVYTILFGVALATALLTAFYTFRAYYRTFEGELRMPDGAHPHEPLVMTVPLIVLALGAVAVGIVAEPFTHWFSGFLTEVAEPRPGRRGAGGRRAPELGDDARQHGRGPRGRRAGRTTSTASARRRPRRRRPRPPACTTCRSTSCTSTRCTTCWSSSRSPCWPGSAGWSRRWCTIWSG